MRPDARPAESIRSLDKADPHQILLHKAHRHLQMIAAESAPVEALLPRMAGGHPLGLEVVRVAIVGAPEGFAQCLLRVGRDNPMGMVGHECLAEHTDAAIPRVALDQIQVDPSVRVRPEDDRAPVASQGHMVRAIGDLNPAIAWHLPEECQRDLVFS